MNLNWKNPDDAWTPLHAACRFGNKEVIELLADHPQIDVNAKNNVSGTPFMLACFWGKLDAVKVLLKNTKVWKFPSSFFIPRTIHAKGARKEPLEPSISRWKLTN